MEYLKCTTTCTVNDTFVHPAGIAEITSSVVFEVLTPGELSEGLTVCGELQSCVVPVAEAIRAAVSADIGVVGGGGGQAGDGAGVGGDINGSHTGSRRIKAGIGRVGNLPGFLIGGAVSPAQGSAGGRYAHQFHIGNLQASRRLSNADVVDIDAIGCSGRVGSINHDGHIVGSGGRGDVNDKLLIRSGQCQFVADNREGAGISRVGHQTNLEGTGGAITLSLQRNLHACQTVHLRQYGILILWVIVCPRIIIGIELQAVRSGVCRIRIR